MKILQEGERKIIKPQAFIPDPEGRFFDIGVHVEPEGLQPQEIGAGGTLWVGRHGEVHNPNQIFYGRLPRFGLSKEGIAQARRTAEFMKDVPLAAAYSSPLLRARQTAALILEHHPNVKLRQSNLLFEVLTQYQGLKQTETQNFNFYEPPAHPQDETLQDVMDRLLKFGRTVLQRHPRQHVLAVTHGDPVVLFHAYYVGMPMRVASIRQPNFYPATASVTRYDFPPEGFTTDRTRVRVTYHTF